MNMNYYQTFIIVSSDCLATEGIVPPVRKGGATKPRIEYELLTNNPYTYTQEGLLFEVHLRHKLIPEEDRVTQGHQIRTEFFKKSHPCLRASMLAKKYGWGFHFNENGKVAIYGIESHMYQKLLKNDGGEMKLVAAMRNRRAGT